MCAALAIRSASGKLGTAFWSRMRETIACRQPTLAANRSWVSPVASK